LKEIGGAVHETKLKKGVGEMKLGFGSETRRDVTGVTIVEVN